MKIYLQVKKPPSLWRVHRTRRVRSWLLSMSDSLSRAYLQQICGRARVSVAQEAETWGVTSTTYFRWAGSHLLLWVLLLKPNPTRERYVLFSITKWENLQCRRANWAPPSINIWNRNFFFLDFKIFQHKHSLQSWGRSRLEYVILHIQAASPWDWLPKQQPNNQTFDQSAGERPHQCLTSIQHFNLYSKTAHQFQWGLCSCKINKNTK